MQAQGADMKELRKYYWNPRNWEPGFINDTDFLYPFNMTCPAGLWTTWHAHPTWGELAFLSEGSGVFESDKGTHLANNRQCVWIPPRVTHDFYLLEQSTNRTIFVDESIFCKEPRFYTMHTIPITPLLRELMLAVDDWHLDFSRESDRRVGLVLWDAVVRSEQHTSRLPIPHDRRLQKLCAAVLSDISGTVLLGEWSKELGMSTKTIARLFMRETKTTFGHWAQLAKMEHARHLLENGSNVTEAALSCGYSSISSFITVFKKVYGFTPGTLNQRRSQRNPEYEEDQDHQ